MILEYLKTKLTFYHSEKKLKYINMLPGSVRKYKLKPKPWWNAELEQ